jgi:hypothetical protein
MFVFSCMLLSFYLLLPDDGSAESKHVKGKGEGHPITGHEGPEGE